MADLQDIINHPDSQSIIDQLVSGATPQEVSKNLKLKYPAKNQAHLRLTAKILQEFLNKYLDMHSDLKSDLAEAKKQDEEYLKNVSPALKNNATYQERVAEIADTELDIIKFAMEILITAKARLEQVFDKIQEDPTKINTKQEYAVIKWYEVVASLIEKYQKVASPGENVTNYNVTLQMVDEQVFAMQEAVRRTILKMSPEESNRFIEIFNQELNTLKPPKPTKEMSQNERMAEVRMLETKINDMEGPNE